MESIKLMGQFSHKRKSKRRMAAVGKAQNVVARKEQAAPTAPVNPNKLRLPKLPL